MQRQQKGNWQPEIVRGNSVILKYDTRCMQNLQGRLLSLRRRHHRLSQLLACYWMHDEFPISKILPVTWSVQLQIFPCVLVEVYLAHSLELRYQRFTPPGIISFAWFTNTHQRSAVCVKAKHEKMLETKRKKASRRRGLDLGFQAFSFTWNALAILSQNGAFSALV